MDCNYHYMATEFDRTSKVNAGLSTFIAYVKRGVHKLGSSCATLVVLGAVSIVHLMRLHYTKSGQAEALLSQLIPVYKQLLKDLAQIGITEVQIHEPVLVYDEASLLPPFKRHILLSVLQEVLPSTWLVSLVMSGLRTISG